MAEQGKRVVVTGGAGFIGSHLVSSLVERGDQVLVIDNFSTSSRDTEVLRGVGVVDADICSDAAGAAVRDFRPQSIFHLAAQINVRKSVEDPAFDAQQNVLGTVRLLEAAQRVGVSQFILASTGGAIYGEQESFPADESHPVRPKCPYGVSKLAAEQYLAYFGTYGGMRTVSMRLANVYGPRQNPKGEAGVVAIFTDRLLRRQPLRVHGDGEQTRDFVFVEDVIAAMVAAADISEKPGFDVFNVGCGIEVSVNTVVEELRKVWELLGQTENNFVVEYGPAMAGEQLRSVISSRKLATCTQWSPRVNLSDGLRRTVESFLA